ncbi:MAG: type II toxin-antitoxin system prevent-host-death family antitoxin [Ignavibacteriales bacterium]
MPNIRPLSDLRNISLVLRECKEDEPVFLTRNGRGRYVLIDIRDYERMQGKPLPKSVAATIPSRKQELEELEFFCELVEE